MTFTDYLGFASMTLLIIGAVNWGVVAIRYTVDDLPSYVDLNVTNGTSGQALYKANPTPDLINLLGSTAPVELQIVVYWTVFGAGIFYLLLFIWNSIELRTVEA